MGLGRGGCAVETVCTPSLQIQSPKIQIQFAKNPKLIPKLNAAVGLHYHRIIDPFHWFAERCLHDVRGAAVESFQLFALQCESILVEDANLVAQQCVAGMSVVNHWKSVAYIILLQLQTERVGLG